MPINPNGWDKFLRAVSTVRTRGALAALTLMLLFFSFWLVVVITTDAFRWVLSLLIIVSLIGFAIFAVFITKENGKTK